MTVTKDATPSIHKKWAAVMAAVDRIAKNGENKEQHYRYTAQADVADAVRKELIAQGLTIVPETTEVVSSGLTPKGTQVSLLIRVAWRVTDVETGESFAFESLGAGTDFLDKAPYKAQTGAHKYAFLMGLSIPTGDDPEVGNAEEAKLVAEEKGSKSSGTRSRRGRQPKVADTTDAVEAAKEVFGDDIDTSAAEASAKATDDLDDLDW